MSKVYKFIGTEKQLIEAGWKKQKDLFDVDSANLITVFSKSFIYKNKIIFGYCHLTTKTFEFRSEKSKIYFNEKQFLEYLGFISKGIVEEK